MKKIVVLVALALVVGTLPSQAHHRKGHKIPPGQLKKIHCRDDLDGTKALSLPVGIYTDPSTGAVMVPDSEHDAQDIATGKYALPANDPTTLVVFAHGYSHKSDSWVEHMRDAARDHGVLAVTMDYRGTYIDEANNVRGWFVKEGAVDLAAAAEFFKENCPSIKKTVLFSVSMGGNAAGLAIAQEGSSLTVGSPSGPLFDYWFNVEGAVNVLETYAGASVLAPANEFAAHALADIEQEMGGTFADDPEGYIDLAVVSHMDEIAASGLKGAVVIHALEDGLVPYNQAREIIPELVNGGIPTEMFTVAGKGDGESGTTITGYSGDNSSPFAGHASEASDTHIIMVTAFTRLWALVDDGVGIESPYAETFVPGV